MKIQRKIELLAPAKNLECGIEAINHGADAVYIGAPKFSARAAAGNSLEDIEALVNYAHLFNAKVYVALNTILKEEELEETQELIWELYKLGVDALIIQDMAFLKMNLPPIALHASTQMDNRTPEKVSFLADAGFQQVVLARELSLLQIREIHDSSPVALEVFVHGALCVSYSGQCYVSQAIFGRSANRGECAQFCRLPFDMVDAEGNVIYKDKHLLSLKDLNRSQDLENLLDAGVSSFKIEGRLKDVTYVKNVTAHYRKELDKILKRRSDFTRSSSGKCYVEFTPRVEKSFNRGFTDYLLRGRTGDIDSFETPKSLGEEVGRVKEIRGNYIVVAGVKSFNNGDGLCYIDEKGQLKGFRVNRVEDNKLFPQEMPTVRPRTTLYRNFDQEFEKTLSKKSSERKIDVAIYLRENNFGFTLEAIDEDENSVNVVIPFEKELARTPQKDNLINQLGKLGNTPFKTHLIEVDLTDNWFIPSSVLSEYRRKLIERLLQVRKIGYRTTVNKKKPVKIDFPQKELTYLGNVMNSKAREFYLDCGVKYIEPAFEANAQEGVPLMFTKHCLRYTLGFCPVYQKKTSPWKEPYYLLGRDGKKFRLKFDCKNCQMLILENKDAVSE